MLPKHTIEIRGLAPTSDGTEYHPLLGVVAQAVGKLSVFTTGDELLGDVDMGSGTETGHVIVRPGGLGDSGGLVYRLQAYVPVENSDRLDRARLIG